ncbi:MAG: Uma2 family endonuclease [Cyanobacteria bacterium P01_F01_bin.150]
MYEFSSPLQRSLPTMYDLPSEEIGEPGLPDEFHRMQAELLRETCQSPLYRLPSSPEPEAESEQASLDAEPEKQRLFIARDLNLYYDSRKTNQYKRPDWFLCLDVPQLNQQKDLRWSYLIWQESVPPFLVVEFLSPGTEADDLGETIRRIDQPPRKWEVYEKYLRVPYYAVYDRYDNKFRLFRLNGVKYQEISMPDSRFWFDELQLGLGIWSGPYEGADGLWLRWYNADNQWIPTEKEEAVLERQRANAEQKRANAEQKRAEQAEATVNSERQRAEQVESEYQMLLKKLQEKGIDPTML